MGLDIYVGPLGRYYAGEWETAVQTAGREQGFEVTITRPPGHRFPPIEEALGAVLAWREGLNRGMAGLIGERLDWSEDPDGEYFTNKPGFDGYSSVKLLAAHEEFPAMNLPPRAPSALTGPLWDLVEDRYTVGRFAAGLRKLMRRRPRPRKIGPFEQVYFPGLWLPIDVPVTLRTTDFHGRPISLGSVHRLRAQLDDLFERVRRSVPQVVAPDIDDVALDRQEFWAVAAHGLRTWRDLAIVADERRLPMILDS